MVERLAPLPVVAVSLDLPGIPTITADDFNGTHQAVEHLISEHHCTRIAFIQGPSGQLEAETRYRAYLSALQDHQLPFDPDLVVSGDFNTLRAATWER